MVKWPQGTVYCLSGTSTAILPGPYELSTCHDCARARLSGTEFGIALDRGVAWRGHNGT
jgi:hypothetical protein